MIDYFTLEHYAKYDPNRRPSEQGGSGGMQSKTHRVLDALQTYFPGSRVVTEVDDIKATVVLIEPLRFTLGDEESFEKLKWVDAKKIIYGGEFAPLRMSPSQRGRFFENADTMTYNCHFLKNLLRYIGIRANYPLTEPVPDVFHPGPQPENRPRRIVAMGSVSWMKNSARVIEIFKRLKGDAERVYIGSSSLWGGDSSKDKELEDELFDNCDKVLSNATPAEIAKELQETTVGFWCAYHDTWSNCVHEMIASGVPVVSSCHGLASELPVMQAVDIASQVKLIHQVLNMPAEEYRSKSESLHAWSQANTSYSVFINQLQHVLKAI